MKSEEAIAGYFSWQKLLKKARAHVGLSSQMMMICIEDVVRKLDGRRTRRG
jgi:hypothetical protein